MRIPPPEVILSWPPPRYDDPETRGPASEIVSLVLLSIASTIIIIRIYTRKWITKGFGWDDILVILAFIPATGFVVVGMISMDHYGWGRHVWDVPLDRFTGSLQMGLASQILFDLATSFTKLSMLALIYRIAHEASRKFCLLVIGLEILIAVNGVVFMLVAMLQCRPLSLYWTLSAEPQNCINEAVHLLVASIINTVTDFVVVLLPLALVRIVYKNKLSPRQMVIVNLLFGAGFLASFAGAARTYFTWIMTTEPDVTWNAWMNWLMSCLELFLGIICTSIPSTKPFFNRYLPKILGTAPRKPQRHTMPSPIDKDAKASQLGSQLSLDSDLEDSASIPMKPQVGTPVSAKRFSEATLNKPLPAVVKKNSVYTINIQLDEASLSPADMRGRATNQPVTTGDHPIHNFSRPKARHTRTNSESCSQHRLSTFSIGEPEYSSRIASPDSSRYSHILDEVNDTYHQHIDDLESGLRYGNSSRENRNFAAATRNLAGHVKGHTKNVSSVGTFGG
ncbi:integral membrane protein [Colletotrichum musicola]|uniref:Integral membrane protein n=1 Tax=Colletotrichum musicola TaxID=2175873 RepID=A0A8H6NXS1_9PEZI|nr:integral membrane protein [Colletotrichum musicola]